MKRTILIMLAVPGMAIPAHATGGFTCRTAGARPIEVSLGFGHVAGSPLLADATRLADNGRSVPVITPQWWFDGTELRVLMADPAGMRREAVMKARRIGRTYDGSLWRAGKRHRVRCRES